MEEKPWSVTLENRGAVVRFEVVGNMIAVFGFGAAAVANLRAVADDLAGRDWNIAETTLEGTFLVSSPPKKCSLWRLADAYNGQERWILVTPDGGAKMERAHLWPSEGLARSGARSLGYEVVDLRIPAASAPMKPKP